MSKLVSKVNKPLSPHLQIYRLPMLARLSITHRITGVFLSLGLLLLPIVLGAIAHGGAAYYILMSSLTAWYGQIVLFMITLSLNFHLGNGIRHLFWDMGYGLDVNAAEKSGLAVMLFTVLLTALVWAVVLF